MISASSEVRTFLNSSMATALGEMFFCRPEMSWLIEENVRMPVVPNTAMRINRGENPRMNLFLSFTVAALVVQLASTDPPLILGS